MTFQNLPMRDLPPGGKQPNRPTLQSPMNHHGRTQRSESPTSEISEMDLADLSSNNGDVVPSPRRMKCGSLILRCADCSSVVLIGYGQGVVPRRLGLPDLSQRSNGIALTNCRRCFARTNKGLAGHNHVTRNQYHLTRGAAMCPTLWDASDFVRAASSVLEERVALMMVGRVCFHISWDRISKSLDAKDRAVSLDTSQVATEDAQRLILPYLAGNWI